MTEYSDLVDEIYIAPIRTVIALDDQFPTLDSLLEAEFQEVTEGEETSAFARVEVDANEIGKAKSLVSYCRDRQWIVDIHDGSKILPVGAADGKVIKHLHQTDLLILDYKLDGEALGGDHAIRILRALNVNPHFNIVIVYTKENITKTFSEIELGLLAPLQFQIADEDRLSEIWQEWFEEDGEKVAALEDQIGLAQYRYLRLRSSSVTVPELESAFAGVKTVTKELAARLKAIGEQAVKAENFVWWLLKKAQSKVQGQLNPEGVLSVEAAPNPTEALNWLRTETLFVTVVHKSAEGAAIIERLRDALCAWQPSPHRLMIASMRAELDERGGAIEDAALKDWHLQIGLLKQLLSLSGAARSARIGQILEHHWSQVLGAMNPNTLKSSQKILDVVAPPPVTAAETIISRFFPAFAPADENQKQKILLTVNSYASTQAVEGAHLTAGHIFEFEQALWVCLSPLCDLVPDQNKSKRWGASLGEALPFKAVKLKPEDPKTALKYATSNVCLFLDISAEIKCFSFVPVGSSRGDPSPHWEQMFANDQGRISEHHTLEVRVLRAAADGSLELRPYHQVTIIAQLKYEYALNLLQRLGTSLARVGLDFEGSA